MGLLTDLLGDGNATSTVADSAAAPLVSALHAGAESTSMVIQGDSTANGEHEWLYTFLEWLAPQFPAYTFWHRLWNDTNQGYARRSAIQIGSAGDRYISLDGTGDYISAPDSAGLSITGDLALVAKVSPTAIPGAAAQSIVTKFGGVGQRSWRFSLNNAGTTVYYDWSADGSTLLGPKFSTATLESVGYDDGATFWLAVTHDVDNGAAGNDIKFWHAADDGGVPGAWTQLGTTITTAGTTSIFDSTTAVEVGSRGGGAAESFAGKIHYVEIRAGVDLNTSDIRASMDPATWRTGSTFKDGEGNTWTLGGDAVVLGAPALTVLNASTSGQVIAYSADATRFALQTPLPDPLLSVVSYSHNEGSGKVDYAADVAGLCDQLRSKYPYIPIVLSTQNPKKAPETAASIKAHALRSRQVAQVAAGRRYGLVNIFATAHASGSPDSYTDTDGIHPSTAGYAAWDEQMRKLFRPLV